MKANDIMANTWVLWPHGQTMCVVAVVVNGCNIVYIASIAYMFPCSTVYSRISGHDKQLLLARAFELNVKYVLKRCNAPTPFIFYTYVRNVPRRILSRDMTIHKSTPHKQNNSINQTLRDDVVLFKFCEIAVFIYRKCSLPSMTRLFYWISKYANYFSFPVSTCSLLMLIGGSEW